MYYDFSRISAYPFEGEFYRFEVDKKLPLEQQVEKRVSILKVNCDIQEKNTTDTKGAVVSKYAVYFEFDRETDFPISNGDLFKGNLYGMDIEGEVEGIYPTQMGCVAYLKDMEV